MSLPFDTLSRFVIAFVKRSKCLLISRLQSASALILEAPKIVCHYLHCFPVYLAWSDGTGCRDLSFWILSFKPTFSLSSFASIQRLFGSSLLSAIRVVSSTCAKPYGDFPDGSVVKNLPLSAGDAGDVGSVHRSGRSPGEGNDNPAQYSCLGNPMGRAAWLQSNGSHKSQTQLSD